MMVVEKKKKPETGATFDECVFCHDRVNATWLDKITKKCIYCKMNGI